MVPLAECRLRPLPRTAIYFSGAARLRDCWPRPAAKRRSSQRRPPRTRRRRARRKPARRRKQMQTDEAARTERCRVSRRPSNLRPTMARPVQKSASIRSRYEIRAGSRAAPATRQTNLPTRLREPPAVLHLKHRATSRAQPAKVRRRCNPKCRREARRRRAT